MRKHSLMKKIVSSMMALILTAALMPTMTAQSATSVSGSDAVSLMQEDNTVNTTNVISGGDAVLGNDTVESEEAHMVTVQVNHYLSSDNSALFMSDTVNVEDGGSISEFIKGIGYYNVDYITLEGNRVSATNGKLNIDVAEDVTSAIVNVYYVSSTGTYKNDVSMFDYTDGGGYDSRSINYYKNYKTHANNANADKKNNDRRIATKGAAGDYNLMVLTNITDGRSLNANSYNTSNNAQRDYTIIRGLLAGVSGVNYENVNFTYEDPGFFSSEPKAGKEILNGYSLEFDRVGMRYTLTKVYDAENTVVCSDVNNFFPLNKKNGNKKNEYFGLRYDFTFEIGDYLGDMTYSFVGDDDLWVCMDGAVILDLGGIHDAYPLDRGGDLGYAPSSVDLWKVLLGKTSYTLEDKIAYSNANKGATHTITVLFMERGGHESNCHMTFVVPHIKAKDPVVDTAPKANLNLVKRIEGTNIPIAEVGFTLYKDVELKTAYRYQESDANGGVVFTGLREGTYYLKETKYDANSYYANETVYTVKVTVANGVATATVVGLEEKSGSAYVIYNTLIPTIDIAFKKIYRYDHAVALEGAQFVLRKDNVNGEKLAEAASDANGAFQFSGLKAGTYFIEETQAPAGYRTPAQGEGLVVIVYEDVETGELKYQINHTNAGSQIYYWTDGKVNYVKNVKGIDVTIIKEWKNLKGQTIDAPADVAQIVVELRRKGTTWDDKVADVILNAENNWTVTLEDLDYESDQGVWTYYIKEKTVVSGYEAEYADVVMDTDTEGAYNAVLTVANVQKPGALKIVKTVDKVDARDGLASFTFEIKCEDGTVLYRTLTFETAGTKEVVIDNLLAGDYTVTELDTLRYELVEGYAKTQTKEVVPEDTTVFEYSNEKVFENYYSHTDVVVNKVTFTKDESGNITDVTFGPVKSSTDEIIVKEESEENY